jgi:hypothetical protein
VSEEELTTWEVAMLLRRTKKGVLKQLGELIDPSFLWALQASCKNARGGRGMELTMSPMMRVNASAQKQMQRQVNATMED